MELDYRTWIPGLHALRDALLDTLEQGDLELGPGGSNPSWRSLLARWLATEGDYRRSFTTLDLTWSAPPELDSLAMYREAFVEEDALLNETVTALSEVDLTAVVARPDLSRSRRDQVQAYVQSELMLLATATVYARALGRSVPPSVAAYIG